MKKDNSQHKKFFIELLKDCQDTFADDYGDDEANEEQEQGYKEVRHALAVLRKANAEQDEVYFHIWQALHKYVDNVDMLSDDLGTYAKTKLIVQLRVEPQLNDSKKYYVDTEGASVEYSTLAQAKKAINKILRGA
jgi:hypothetical protein